MLIGLNQDNDLVHAQYAKESEDYRCPECLCELILRKGRHTITHFAHKSNSACSNSAMKKESLEHISSKHHIYAHLNNKVQVDMEYYLSEINQIPDIIINKRLIVEFQYSPINFTLLLSRTEGYHALNMDVKWIGKDVTYSDGMLHLNYFEAALINCNERTLLTYNPTTQKLIRYEHIQSIDKHLFIANRRVIQWIDLIPHGERCEVPTFYLTDQAYDEYISKCKKQRNVLEPTLSILYQARLLNEKRLDIIGIIVPEQIYFLTHCITWQAFIYKEIKEGTFSFNKLYRFIKFRSFHFNYSKMEVLKRAVNTYFTIIQKKAISRAKSSV